VTYVVDDFGNGELDGGPEKGEKRSNPPPGQPGACVCVRV
jgi:hypothetical protein